MLIAHASTFNKILWQLSFYLRKIFLKELVQNYEGHISLEICIYILYTLQKTRYCKDIWWTQAKQFPTQDDLITTVDTCVSFYRP